MGSLLLRTFFCEIIDGLSTRKVRRMSHDKWFGFLSSGNSEASSGEYREVVVRSVPGSRWDFRRDRLR